MAALRSLHVAPRSALVVGLAGLLAALLPGPALPVFAVLLVAGAGLVATDAVRAAAADDLAVERVLSPSTTIATVTPVSLVLRNPTGRAVTAAVHDAGVPSATRVPRDHRTQVPARGRAELAATVTPARRGDLAFGPVTVRTTGPWGLAGRQGRVPLPGSLRVNPRLPGRREVELRLSGNLALLPGLRRTRIVGNGTEFDSLRDHHADDDHRHINWQATARAGRPIANVLREEKNQHVLLLLDAGRAMAGMVDGTPRIEWAIDAAVAVAEMASRTGDHVGAWAFDSRMRAQVPPRTGRRQGARVLDALFAVEASLDASGWSAAFARVLATHRRRSLLVLLTDLPDPDAIDGLLAALPALVRHHVVVVGAVRDPRVHDALHTAPSDSEQAHLAAAAATATADRTQAARRLSALGARVVDTTPDRLAGALVDSYLDLKSAGRL